jgi:Xaa-Pro aminopeptidase
MLTKRLLKIQEALKANGLDWVALLPGTNLFYLTGVGFHSTERTLIGLFSAEGAAQMVIPTLECTKIRDNAPFEITYHTWDDGEGPEKAFLAAVASMGVGDARVGVEALTMRFQEIELFRKHAPEMSLHAADKALASVRSIKDDAELQLLRKAIEISETALAKTLPTVVPGQTEREIANLVKQEILSAGGEPTFVLVQGGETTTRPHAEGSDRRVAVGEPLLVDWGGAYGGYTADITRTFVMGSEPDPRLVEIYELVKAANLAGRNACGPGVPAQDVDHATRKVIENGNYGEFFIHRTGHGLGLDFHEDPYIVHGNAAPLEVGNVFTIEPGIYAPGLGGVRIEDDVVITADGVESLTTFDRDLRVVGI